MENNKLSKSILEFSGIIATIHAIYTGIFLVKDCFTKGFGETFWDVDTICFLLCVLAALAANICSKLISFWDSSNPQITTQQRFVCISILIISTFTYWGLYYFFTEINTQLKIIILLSVLYASVPIFLIAISKFWIMQYRYVHLLAFFMPIVYIYYSSFNEADNIFLAVIMGTVMSFLLFIIPTIFFLCVYSTLIKTAKTSL